MEIVCRILCECCWAMAVVNAAATLPLTRTIMPELCMVETASAILVHGSFAKFVCCPASTLFLCSAGMRIRSKVHVSVGYNNAYWDSISINYGDGDGSKCVCLLVLEGGFRALPPSSRLSILTYFPTFSLQRQHVFLFVRFGRHYGSRIQPRRHAIRIR